MARERRRSAVYEPDYPYLISRVGEARTERGLAHVEVAKALDNFCLPRRRRTSRAI